MSDVHEYSLVQWRLDAESDRRSFLSRDQAVLLYQLRILPAVADQRDEL